MILTVHAQFFLSSCCSCVLFCCVHLGFCSFSHVSPVFLFSLSLAVLPFFTSSSFSIVFARFFFFFPLLTFFCFILLLFLVRFFFSPLFFHCSPRVVLCFLFFSSSPPLRLLPFQVASDATNVHHAFSISVTCQTNVSLRRCRMLVKLGGTFCLDVAKQALQEGTRTSLIPIAPLASGKQTVFRTAYPFASVRSSSDHR